MLAKATENTVPVLPLPAPARAARAARFARDPSECATGAVTGPGTIIPASAGTAMGSAGTTVAGKGTGRPVQLVLIAGGATAEVGR